MFKTVISPAHAFDKTVRNKQILFRLPAEMITGCMLNWKGIAFTEHMATVMNTLADAVREERAVLEIVVRDPDYKLPLTYAFAGGNRPEVKGPSHYERDLASLGVLSKLVGRELKHGSCLVPNADFVDALRGLYKSGASGAFCYACRFGDMCAGVAENDFKGTRLKGA